MLLEAPVEFPNGVPSLDSVRQRVSERSGLRIELQCDAKGNATLENPEFPRPCELAVGQEQISLILPVIRQWCYLEYVTLAALVDLGGQSPYKELPKYVNTKWHDRKWWQFIPRD